MTEAGGETPIMNDATPLTFTPSPMAPTGKRAFIPLSRPDVVEAALSPSRIPGETDRQIARRVFYKMGCLRQHQSAQTLNELADIYDLFNPDDDTINLREFSTEERSQKRAELVAKLRDVALSANYDELTEAALEAVLDQTSPEGVHVDVDFSEFEVRLIFFRGEAEITRTKRDVKTLYLKKRSYSVPVYSRLLMALKFKTEEVRIAEIMAAEGVDEDEARKKLRRLRKHIPAHASVDHVYLKIFKNIPRHDVEMLFPNIRVKMKYTDKLQLGGSAVFGFLTWLIGTATKLVVAVALSPVMLVLALVTGVGGIMYAQIRNIFITRDRYRMQLAQSLYFQNLANNLGALALIVDEAEEEDVKEEVLLYSYLLYDPAPAGDIEWTDRKIEEALRADYGIDINFDVHDALERLMAAGLVFRNAAGELQAMPLAEADRHLSKRWCDAIEAAA